MTLAVGKSKGRKSFSHSVFVESSGLVVTTWDTALGSDSELADSGVQDQGPRGCPPTPWTATMLQESLDISTSFARSRDLSSTLEGMTSEILSGNSS